MKALTKWMLVWGIGALGVCLGAEPGPLPVKTLTDLQTLEQRIVSVSEKALPATVALVSGDTNSSGSGVVTSPDGMILTAAHVIQGSEEISVVFPDGKEVLGDVLGANFSKDIALVKIRGEGPWPYAERGNSKQLKAGDWVVALGHSAGFDPNRTPPVRFGHVVSKGPGNFLTTDCTLIGGDSGGPLFDLDGKIIGVNSSIGVSLRNNNHAGVDGFAEDWDRMVAGEAWGKLSTNPLAYPDMPVLGIVMGMPSGLPGVPVESIQPRSPAGAAGIRRGDVIRSLNGMSIRSGMDLNQLLAKQQAGDVVKVGVLRDDELLELDVTLASRGEVYRED